MSTLPSIPAQITALRAKVGELAHRAVVGNESLNTSAISDATDALNAAMQQWKNGDSEDARESIQLAIEQLDAAEAEAD